MSTLVAMWTRISRGYDPIPPASDLGYAENFMYMCFGEQADPDHQEEIEGERDECSRLHRALHTDQRRGVILAARI